MATNFLISRLTASFQFPCTQIPLCSLLQHNAFLFFNSFTSGTFSEPKSGQNHHKGDTFTVSYFINSCGLSPDLAKKLSKQVNLTNPDGPNAVLRLLKNYGFSKTQISKFVERRPLVLVANAEATLLPKLKFFHSIGVSTADLPKILIDNHPLITRSLKNCLIPRYETLRSVVGDDQEAVRALKRNPYSFLLCDIINDLVPNIKVLRQSGVPQASISYLMMHQPGTAYMKHSKVVEAVNTVKEMGFNPLRRHFVIAVVVLTYMNKAMWKSRLEVLERWGWSREISLQAFRKYPNFMTLSEERVTKSMSFLVKDMGWSSEDIAGYPLVLLYNLEKRIIPRCSIIKILKSKGLVKNHLQLSSFIVITEETFLKKYVTKFEEDVPVLPNVYKGLISHLNVI